MIEPDHTARAVWELAGRLDLSGFRAEIESVEDEGAAGWLKHARYCGLLLAESHLTRRFFGAMLRRIELLPLPVG